MLSLIAAVAENDVIGRDGDLPWHLPADLKFFKATTLGKPVIMGRRTWAEVGKPLPGRQNIVISRQPEFTAPGAQVVADLASAIDLAGDVPETMIIGGAQIYAEALPIADRFYRTLIHGAPAGDTRFPPVDWSQWSLADEIHQPADENNAMAMTFQTFERAG